MFDLQLGGSPHVPGVSDQLAQPGDVDALQPDHHQRCDIAADCFDSLGMTIHLRGEDMPSSFHQVTVLGAGVLGAQISFQIAYRGFEVTTYDISDAALKQAF
jgi:3-hydroxyacyl-CoA dehydrogenase, NAD binding domain